MEPSPGSREAEREQSTFLAQNWRIDKTYSIYGYLFDHEANIKSAQLHWSRIKQWAQRLTIMTEFLPQCRSRLPNSRLPLWHFAWMFRHHWFAQRAQTSIRFSFWCWNIYWDPNLFLQLLRQPDVGLYAPDPYFCKDECHQFRSKTFLA